MQKVYNHLIERENKTTHVDKVRMLMTLTIADNYFGGGGLCSNMNVAMS